MTQKLKAETDEGRDCQNIAENVEYLFLLVFIEKMRSKIAVF